MVGAVLVDRGRVLAARRTRPTALAGQWEFPGGKVEPGEDPSAALVREIAEELNLAITVGPELSGAPWPISSAYELRLFLAALADTGEPRPGPDHDQISWLAPDLLRSVRWLPADEQALDAVRTLLTDREP